MKKVLITVSVLSILAVGALALAHGPGGGGYGHMMNPGYGNHMMGPGHGGHMMGWGGQQDGKFLDETADLRRELHNKKFEYFEAVRKNDTKGEVLSKMEREIFDIQQKIRNKAPRSEDGGFRGMGCW